MYICTLFIHELSALFWMITSNCAGDCDAQLPTLPTFEDFDCTEQKSESENVSDQESNSSLGKCIYA